MTIDKRMKYEDQKLTKKTKPASTTKMGKVKTNSRPSGIAKKGLGLLGKKK